MKFNYKCVECDFVCYCQMRSNGALHIPKRALEHLFNEKHGGLQPIE